MSDSILKMKALLGKTGKARSSIYAAIKDGDFPAPVALGPRAVGWLESDITTWIESRPKAGRVRATKKQTGVA